MSSRLVQCAPIVQVVPLQAWAAWLYMGAVRSTYYDSTAPRAAPTLLNRTTQDPPSHMHLHLAYTSWLPAPEPHPHHYGARFRFSNHLPLLPQIFLTCPRRLLPMSLRGQRFCSLSLTPSSPLASQLAILCAQQFSPTLSKLAATIQCPEV